ncbi:MAG: polyprenol monophosphomannose synthase [Thaumarchaeota archaeon]|nr:polyprenol monophosphomannose synthase [Nitrososphaerota archaeon]
MASPQGICVVVPTYNEKENVPKLVDEVRNCAIQGLSLLFVDDSSPDGTSELVRGISSREPWVRLLVRTEKRGIGSAYQDGFKEAISTLAPEIIVEMDADLQHPPSAIAELVKTVRGGADVAVGSRYIAGGSVSGWNFWRRVVSKGANGYARTLLGLPVRDSTSGFRAYGAKAAAEVANTPLPAKGFEFQVASLQLLKTNMRIVEVPYTFSARALGKSKLGLRDMLRFFVAVLRIALS